MNNRYNDEIPKYIKQKESNVSKANKKSKHKHKYEECLIQYNMKIGLINKPTMLVTSLSSYCIICGKIGDKFKDSIVTDYLKSEYINGKKFYSVMSGEELYEKYHNRLPVFFVDDILQDKYINLEQK